MKRINELLINIGIWLFKHFIKPYQELRNNSGLTRENIESFLQHRSVSEYLNYASCKTDKDGNSVYLLKDGRYGIALRVYLPPYPSDKIEEQLKSFLKSVNEDMDVVTFNTFVSQNLDDQFKGFLDSHPCEVNIKHRDILKQQIYRRYEYLKRSTRESFFPKVDFRIRNYINTVSIIFSEEISQKDAFMKIETIKSRMGAYHAESIDPELFVSLQREFFFNSKEAPFWNDSTDTYTSIDKQVTRGGLKVDVADKEHPHGFVMNDETYVSVLTTKKFPKTIDYDEMDALFVDRYSMSAQPNIRGPYFTSLVLDYRDIKKIKKETMDKVQANFNETIKHGSKEQKKRPHLKARKVESQMTIELLESGEDRPVPGQWTMVLYDNDLKTLTQSVSAVQNSFSHKGWEIIPETFGHVAFFEALHALPLQLNVVIDEFLKRKPILFESSNHVPIIPWIGESQGFTNNRHIPWVSRTGQLQWFDPMDSNSNFNIAASGVSGGGKSYTVNDIVTLSLGANYLVRIIDSLPSYKKSTLSLGGQYEEFGDANFCMNFFTNIMLKTDEITNEVVKYVGQNGNTYSHISDEDYNTIIPMLGAMIGANLISSKSESTDTANNMTNAYLSSILEEAVRVSFEGKGRDAGVKEIYEYIIEKYNDEKEAGNEVHSGLLKSAYTSLARFGDEKGIYFHQFNGVNNLDIYYDYATFELTKLEGKGILYPLTLMSLANQISTEFFDMRYVTRPKILIIEEFWKYINMPVVLNFSIELTRKVRKAGGIFMPVTQGIDDYFVNDLMKSIYDNCAWQFLLKNKPVSIDNAIESKKLSVSPLAAELLKNITPKKGVYGEFALIEGASLQFSVLRVDGVSHYLYTTSDKDELLIRNTSKRLNVSYEEAILFLGIQRDFPSWDEDRIMIEAGLADMEDIEKNKEALEKRDALTMEALEKVLELSNFIVEDRFVYDKHDNVVMNILRFGIKNSRNDLLYFDEYSKKMLEMELDSDLMIQMFDKALQPEHINAPKIGVVIPLDTLMDNRLYVYARDKWKTGKYKHITFIVDISLNTNVQLDEIKPVLQNWRDFGISISIKRYNYSVDNQLALEIEPDYTIIDVNNFEDENILNKTVEFATIIASDVMLINSKELSADLIEKSSITFKDSLFSEMISEESTTPLIESIEENV